VLVDRLRSGHATFGRSGMADLVTDTLLMALRRLGRDRDADKIKSEYLRTHRRETLPPPYRLRELRVAD
jgi:hypothetical protein